MQTVVLLPGVEAAAAAPDVLHELYRAAGRPLHAGEGTHQNGDTTHLITTLKHSVS